MTTHALVVPHDRSLARAPVGEARTWSRDLAAVGAATMLTTALLATPAGLALAAFATLAGATVGAAIGALMPRVLGAVRRKPVVLLMGAALGVGSLWGIAAGLVVAPALGSDASRRDAVLVLAFAGMVQLGWLWLPYAVRSARRASPRALVLAACALSPVVALLAHWHVHPLGLFF